MIAAGHGRGGALACAIVLGGLAALASGCGSETSARPVVNAGPAPAPAPKLTFIEDDYARALAEAKAQHKPLFIDAWALWCHTCLSMREYVFVAPEVRARGNDFVWLSIDTEKDSNAAFVKTHSMEAWPTLWVIDSATETPALRWNGSTTSSELVALLDDAKLAIAQGGNGGGDAAAAYLRGNKDVASGNYDDAIVSYKAALAAAPAEWPRRSHVVEALSARYIGKKDWVAAVDLAAAELPKMKPSTSAKSVAYDALRAVMQLPAGANAEKRDQVIASTERLADQIGSGVLADDRSDLYDQLVDVLEDVGRKQEKERVARKWVDFLEKQVSQAKTSAERAVFDSHRVNAYLAVGEPERAVTMLQESEKAFPDDYNPPARLAYAYFHMKKYDDALAAIDRALTKSYGPRKLRHLTLKADILAAKGDKQGERAAVEQALAHAKGLELTGSIARVKDGLEARLKALPPR